MGILLVLILPRNWEAMIVCTLAFGFGVSTNSIWYLTFNEVYLFRTNPFLTIALNLSVVLLANMAGANFLMFVKNFSQNPLTLHYFIFGTIFSLLIFAMIFCFYLPEIKNNVGAFQPPVLKQLSRFSWWKVIIFVLLFFVTILRELSQGDFLNLLLAQETWVKYHNKTIVEQYIHSVQEIWWIAQIIGAVLIYHFFC
ncbi:hypothetical protein [Spiroplasma endosymbiont of Glossina fuscipes fuscipes]|uniref:hypothetical protein n=1 Tax=Spiroplasma endosymbiont of Glossina fuscipes fuscipes TaxID=2004463 RepID=UPI003CEFE25E